MRRSRALSVLSVCALVAASLAFREGTSQSQAPTYASVKPIFDRACIGCHQSQAAMAGLRLDTYANIMKGSTSGKVIVPKKSGDSLLYKRISGAKPPVMPPPGALPASEQKKIKDWIDSGAKER
ncbi:MAG: hypothetical protein HND42_01465 [Armatimonadetes bacterium]|nr:hypothetical protein [Armatimonadota bacterium]NOG91900.1 hypothetical protein [Armatimonadota bacterium]